MTIIEQWEVKTPQAQLDYIMACIVKDAPLEVERGTVSWFLSYHGIEDLAAEAWLHIAEVTPEVLDRLNSKRTKSITLAGIVWRAARHAIRTADGSDKRHSHEPLDWLDEDGDEHGRPIAGGYTPEEEALYREWLNDFMRGLDETDKQIVKGRLDGMQQNEIAEVVGISPTAICKRLKKLRAAVAASI